MIRAAAASVLVAVLGAAPMQCRHHPETHAWEESPGDALFALSQEFYAKGNVEAARETLRFLVVRYPSNRHAPAARIDLGDAPHRPSDCGQ